MRTLVLHIGTHKTGTTTIQNALAQGRSEYRRNGILYPATVTPDGIDLNKHISIELSLRSEAAFNIEKDKVMREFENSNFKTLVLSEEGFSAPPFERIRLLEEMSREFDRTVVICFLRRQDIFVESLWNQHCRDRREARPLRAYARLDEIKTWIKYDQMLSLYESFSETHAEDYEKAKKAGLLSEFFRTSKLPEPTGIKEQSLNKSPSMNCAATINVLNRRKIEYDKRKIMNAFRFDSLKFALGSNLRREILEQARETNRVLKQKYGIEFDDTLPDEPEEPLVFPERGVIARAIGNLSKI